LATVKEYDDERKPYVAGPRLVEWRKKHRAKETSDGMAT
jgi:hypothetical protein